MNISYDLEQVRRKVGLIELNLSDVKKQLLNLEAQVLQAQAVVEPQDTPVAPAVQAVADVSLVKEPAVAEVPVPPVVEPVRPAPPPLPRYNEYIPTPVEKLDPAEKEEVFTEEPPSWKTWLQRLQLWPPEGDGNNEVRLGAWWATRVGTLLAVIGVVFFGVYVSLKTEPWVKFVELLSICGGVAVFGLWLERRMARFGAVVFSGGLALVYFCAFAAYALPAVRVLTSLPAAVGWQLAAVLLIAAAAISRKSSTIATMAVGLGYVSAVFSRSGGLHEFALITAGLLAVAAVVFQRRRRWEGPSVVALPGAYAVYALVLTGNWLKGTEPGVLWPWLFLGGVATLFYVRDWRAVRIEHSGVTPGERWFQGANSSLAVLLGVITALTLYREHLTEFYFGTAVLLGVFAALRRAQVKGDAIGAVLLAKASGAFTLGVIEAVDGRTTALALLVQAWVMLFSARRLKSQVLAAGTAVVALTASVFFFREAGGHVPLWSLTMAGDAGFALGISWIAVMAARSIEDAAAKDLRTLVEWGGALIAGAAAMVSVHRLESAGAWEPALLMGAAALLGLPGIWRKALAPTVAGLLLLGAAQVALWTLTGVPAADSLVANALWVLVPTAIVGVLVGGPQPKDRRGGWAQVLEVLGTALSAIVIAGFAHVLFATTAPVAAFAIMVLVALGLGGAAGFWTGRHLPWLATWAGFLGLAWWVEHGAGVNSFGWLAMATAGLWLLPAGLHASRRHAAELRDEPAAGWLVLMQIAMALVVTLRALPGMFPGAHGVTALAVVALAVFGLSRWQGIRFMLAASWVLWLAAGWKLVGHGMAISYSIYDYRTLSFMAVAVFAWLPAVVLARKPAEKTGERVQTAIATLLALVACHRCFQGADLLLALLVALAVAVAMRRAGRVKSADAASAGVAVWTLLDAVYLVSSGGAEGWGRGLASTLLVAAAWVALPLLIPQAAGRKGWFYWSFGVGGLGLVFFTAVVQRGALDPYASVAWGLASIVVFMTGLFARVRPYRMLGLLGLAVCVPRIFIVDLDSALHRIAAFVVLGLVLLWVGFSYHRFRHLIADEPAGGKNT